MYYKIRFICNADKTSSCVLMQATYVFFIIVVNVHRYTHTICVLRIRYDVIYPI